MSGCVLLEAVGVTRCPVVALFDATLPLDLSGVNLPCILRLATAGTDAALEGEQVVSNGRQEKP